MTENFKPLIFALKKEVLRLEKIAARFEKSNSMHVQTTRELIDSINKQIEKLKAGRI
jgi:hypothetical protein